MRLSHKLTAFPLASFPLVNPLGNPFMSSIQAQAELRQFFYLLHCGMGRFQNNLTLLVTIHFYSKGFFTIYYLHGFYSTLTLHIHMCTKMFL